MGGFGGLGGFGTGLAKMMEGVSGGALAGKQMEYQDKRYQEQRAEQILDNEARAQNETNRLKMMAEKNQADSDLANQRIAMEKRRVAVSTISTAFDIAKDAPNPKDVFKAIQERLNPGEPVVDIDLHDKTDKVTISFPGSEKGQGWRFTGPKDKVSEMLTLANQNPNRTNEIVQKAAELGVIEAVVIPFKPVKAGGAGGAHGGGKAHKVSDFVAGIKSIGAKYSVDTSGGFVVGADGAVSVNPSAMMGGKTTAYNAIKKLIRESKDPAEKAQAEADLKNIDYYYTQIDKTLGAPAAARVPGAATPPKGPVLDEKAIQSTIEKWRKAGYNVTRESVIAELKKRGKL